MAPKIIVMLPAYGCDQLFKFGGLYGGVCRRVWAPALTALADWLLGLSAKFSATNAPSKASVSL